MHNVFYKIYVRVEISTYMSRKCIMNPQLSFIKCVRRKKALKIFKNILFTNYVMLKLVLPCILVNVGQ